MPFRTLVATAVLLLIYVPGSGCTQPKPIPATQPLLASTKPIEEPFTMPEPDKVTAVGSTGLSAEVRATTLAGRVVLMLRFINPDNTPRPVFVFDYHNPERKFVIWLLCDGEAVPLTDDGKRFQQRVVRTGPFTSGGPQIATSKPWEIELRWLFKIEKPGKYIVVVEDGPVFPDDPERASHAAKTSFVLSP